MGRDAVDGAPRRLVVMRHAKAEATAEMDYRPLDPPLRFGVYCMHLEDRPLSRLSRSFIKLMAEVLGEVVES